MYRYQGMQISRGILFTQESCKFEFSDKMIRGQPAGGIDDDFVRGQQFFHGPDTFPK